MKTYQVLISLIVTMSGALIGCLKQVESVSDSGPQVQLMSPAGEDPSVKPLKITLNRGQDDSVAHYSIFAKNLETITKIDSKLTCGDAQWVHSQPVNGPQDLVVTFNEISFPKLHTLPRVNRCNLNLIVTNSIGSTRQLNIPTQIEFASHFPIQIQTIRVQHNAYEFAESTNHFDVLEFRFDNSLNRSVGFKIMPQNDQLKSLIVYSGYVNGMHQSLASNRMRLLEPELIIYGNGLKRMTSEDGSTHVVVAPGGRMSVKLRGWLRDRPKVSLQHLAHIPTGSIPLEFKSACLYLKELNPRAFIVQWAGFEPTDGHDDVELGYESVAGPGNCPPTRMGPGPVVD
ncbi:MAG: hypothetical protein IT289_01675 [Oligoflexia bacterium]|nr:hypothetical protein [Oligoflexia bacterium]